MYHERLGACGEDYERCLRRQEGVRLRHVSGPADAASTAANQLLKGKVDEIRHQDFYVDESNRKQLQTEKKECEEQDLITQIDAPELEVEKLSVSCESADRQMSEEDIASMEAALVPAKKDAQIALNMVEMVHQSCAV